MGDIVKRDSLKTSIVRIASFINGVDHNNLNKADLITRKKALDTYWERFQDVHDVILNRTGSQEVEIQRIEFNDVESIYFSTATQFSTHIKSLEQAEQVQLNKPQAEETRKLDSLAVMIRKIKVLVQTENAVTDSGIANSYAKTLDRLYSQFEGIAISELNEEVIEKDEWLLGVQNDYHIASGMLSTYNSQHLQNQGNRHHEASTDNIKLPRLEPPTFDGSVLGWESFRDLYVSLIHQRGDITPVRKFQYLKCCMKGAAETLLRNFALTNENYESAWQLLLDRYDNKKVLVSEYLRQFMHQPSCKETAEDLKTLLNKSSESLRALANLGRPVGHWDDWIVYLITQRLDSESRKLWEQSQCATNEQATWADLQQFLQGRIRALEAITPLVANKGGYTQSRSQQSIRTHQMAAAPSKCVMCSKPHRLPYCFKFKRLSVLEKRNFLRSRKLCYNCMREDHQSDRCPSDASCQKCEQKHHSMVHMDQNAHAIEQRNVEVSSASAPAQTSTLAHQSSTALTASCSSLNISSNFSQVMLATAVVNVARPNGEIQKLRALLDQGSQASFITESAVQTLGLKKHKINMSISGVGSTNSGTSRRCVSFQCFSCHGTPSAVGVDALVLPKITSMPQLSSTLGAAWAHIEGLHLADPHFYQQDKIDLLLGADVYSRILLNDVRRGPVGTPTAQRTLFGWILSGKIGPTRSSERQSQVVNYHVSIDDQLKLFWEIEQIPERKRHHTRQEEMCENFYAATYRRDVDGRFVVRLPLINGKVDLGESQHSAFQRLWQMEKRFAKDPEFKKRYAEFMQQYEELQHMEKVVDKNNSESSSGTYYIPHHAVCKESSTTTKLRVVFDASRRTTNGLALNEQLLTGPRLQQDLPAIMMQWRKHAVVFKADVEKMYRQILVDERDRDLQRIVWRESTDRSVQHYRLNTVTYGTSAAPYLAIKTLRQLAINERDKYPVGSTIALSDFYVDDVLSGCDNVDMALEAQNQLITLLSSGKFNLRKWSSNRLELLEKMPPEDLEKQPTMDFNIDDGIKTLGVYWQPTLDQFGFKIQMNETSVAVTKRSMLSDIAKLYDPLGWLAPTTVMAKMLLQSLWRHKLQWDDPLPSELAENWKTYREQLPVLESLKIPRWLGTSTNQLRIEIHGFCDASMNAYSAAVYIRVITSENDIMVNLLAAKTKVAPLKTISIPRLELCGAVLLAELLSTVKEAMVFADVTTYAWTDSTIVLAWLNGDPSRWNVFVANRVVSILQTMSPNQWNHVASEDNAADCASRGVFPVQLNQLEIWWHGPHWLHQSQIHWPTQNALQPTAEEMRKTIHHVKTDRQCQIIIDDFSTLSRLCRVTAWIIRFCSNTKKSKTERTSGPLQPTELTAAQLIWIKQTQREYFSSELDSLKAGSEIKRNSSITRLTPFLHTDGTLRVGGRLQRSPINFDERHPIILPKQAKLTQLLIQHAHLQNLHGGGQASLAYLRRNFWIIDARNQIRFYIHRCIKCFRLRTPSQTQLMASLPAARVTPTRPFTHTAIDYSGFIKVRSSKGRGQHSTKAYVALFVCFVTKAVHLEVVSDLTTAAFLAAFKRFTARRGKCSDIYSDNGTNFVGACTELKKQNRLALKEQATEISNALSADGINWHFSPPLAPHFNGLAEAGIKSTKYHLKRIIGESALTFEELTTLLTQIEAVLNSRPLYPMTADPNDLSPLTPGHFLIGAPLNAAPEKNLCDVNENRLTRWERVQQMHQVFWKRWSKEYLHHMIQRTKWTNLQPELQIGNLVLIKEDNLPPLKWSLGRITKVHKGSDGHVRVAEINHGRTTSTRAIVKLALLPIHDNGFSSV